MKIALLAFATLAYTALGQDLRGSNVSYESSSCTPETSISITCKSKDPDLLGPAMSEILDMTCDEAKSAQRSMIKDFCVNRGGRSKVNCTFCPDETRSRIACRWFGNGKALTCPNSRFASKYSENYTCDNGYHMCCTDSSIDEVEFKKIGSVCRRDVDGDGESEDVGKVDVDVSEA
eukprot:CAMPEP_0196228652 /NCGR_PEP_ID=MMETSP0913-20130531/509_1 /TAXON_ID=49265 /ORGANISM="Thalassiosira rotula, Strain GSO102" /LENGTH=175 /DNA_ID=CAMNT_0041508333 /DNA_START=182 /DNA_END=709 /DNA_ORIENTATION=-